MSEALGVVLDRLTPAERTAFVLHDVFDFPYDAVAEIVGRSVGACRQLARRARLAVRSDAPRTFAAPGRPPVHDVAERFVAACEGGDIDALMALLDPHVDGEATLLGAGPMVHSHGAGEVATRVLALFGPSARRRLAAVALEAGPGLVGVEGDRVVAVIRLELAEGPHGHDVVRHIQAFVRAPG